MKIERTQLVNDLVSFATTGNGVVLGQPGGGKTYVLGELRSRLRDANIPHLIIPVERLGRATEPEIRNVLQREGDFVALLKMAVSGAKAPAVLVFDGYDAARGENERAGVFQLIVRAVNELAGCWHTIVSVRTFDAKKSQRLLALFPDRDRPGNERLPCRQFLVPELQTTEVDQALEQIPGLKALHEKGTSDFRRLLTVPFNLWLIEQVFLSGAKAKVFSRITSEVQLLELYWDYRIRKAPNAEDREFILARVATAMVESHTLTVRRESGYRPEVREAWEGLLSDEVFVEVPGREVGVSFKHNILFDFAVSAHLLDGTPSKLADFVAIEPARPLFLRPSLLYHFTRLWHFDRDAFWRNFWAVVQRDEAHFRQIIRLVLPAVVVSEAQGAADLEPLTEKLKKSAPLAVEAVAFLLQALKVLKPSRNELWAKFLRLIGPHLDRRFAWDAGTIATRLVESPALQKQSVVDCAELGRNLLEWAWEGRKDASYGQWLERLAGLVAVPLVARTYATDGSRSRKLLERVLAVVGESDFPIDCIFRLVNEAEHIIPHDPELVGEMYERVFGYEERSDAKTNMGGPVLPLISNRRQDYESCRYSLIQLFPAFIAEAEMPALTSGLRAVQAAAINDHVAGYLKKGKTVRDIAQAFQFRGSTARYFEDGSHIWDQSSYPDQEMALADGIFKWLGGAAKQRRAKAVDSFLEVFAEEAQTAFLWIRLMSEGKEHPKFLGRRIWELAIAKPVVEGYDTLQPLGDFLEHVAATLPKAKRIQIEDCIMQLPRGTTREQKEHAEHRRNRLIACVPHASLATPAAKALRETLEAEKRLPPNTPLVRFSSSSEPYSEEAMFREQGVKPDSPANVEFHALYRPLADWEQKPDEAQIDGLLLNAQKLELLLAGKNAADAMVVAAASTHLASFVSNALLRTKDSSSERFRVLRAMILATAKDPNPVPYPDHDSKWQSASWSPAPRIEAAQAICWLTHFGQDADALSAIKNLAQDPVPPVRFLLACELWRLQEHSAAELWTLLNSRVAVEPNGVVLQGITNSLWRLLKRDKARSLALMKKLLVRVEETDDEEKALASLVPMVVDFAVEDEESWAKETLATWRAQPLKFSSSLSLAGRRLIEYMKPEVPAANLEKARTLLIEHLGAAATALTTLQKKESGIPVEEAQKQWRSVYGVIDNAVMRIYFAADIDPNLRQRRENPLTDAERKQFFFACLPVLKKVLSFGSEPETGMLLAPTAHHFMELLNGVVGYDPELVLSLAAEVVLCSKRFNYNLDSMAMKETVQLVESLLADYRDKIQDDASIKNLLALLDAFVEAGWPDALNLVWRLDEIYR